MRHSTLILILLHLCGAVPQARLHAQGTGWSTPLNSGLLAPSPTGELRYDDVFFISRDTGILVSSYGMIFKTYDGAAHWTLKKVTDGKTYFRSVEFSADGQVGIAGTLSGTVYRSADRGETWEDISVNIQDTGKGARLICGLAHYGNTFYGVGWWGSKTARVHKSTNAGLTWTTSYLDTNLVSGLIDAAFLTKNKGFVTGFHTKNGIRESVVLRTLDGGITWTKVFSDNTIGGRIWKIQFIDNDYGVGSIEPMYKDTVAMIKTTDGGNTWQIVGAGKISAWPLTYGTQGVGFMDRQKGWLGGYYNGMFETTDGGQTWNFLAINEECNRFFPVDNIMYVSANTVYKYTGTPTNAVAAVAPPVFLHTLSPVTPNPASGTVHIEFDIRAHQTNTVLEIVDLAGRHIYPVMSGYLEPGHYSYNWDGANAPNGNYLVWLGTDEIPMVQQFVLRN